MAKSMAELKKNACSVCKAVFSCRSQSTMVKSTGELKKILLSVESHVFVPGARLLW